MSGAWYALGTIGVALVIWWFIRNDTGPSGLKSTNAEPKETEPRGE